MNNCILASSSSLVFGNCTSQFVNNLQMLGTGQAFVLDFYRTRRKIYRKQPFRADLKKKLLLKSRQNLLKNAFIHSVFIFSRNINLKIKKNEKIVNRNKTDQIRAT